MASTTLLGRATLTLQHDFVHLPVPLELCGGENGGFDGEDGNSGGADADAAAAAAAAAAALKEWVWLNHKDLLLEQFVVQCNSGRKRAIEETEDKQAAISSSQTEDTRGDSHGAAAASDLSTAVVSESAAVDHPESSTKKSLDLLATMVRVHRQFFDSQSSKVVFGVFLEALLDIMDSEYGFIGEIKYGGAGSGNERMYLQTHAITNIAWDQASRQFYDDNIENGLKFYNLNTLFGAVMTTGKPVISNQPQSDPRASGIPPGHPPLNHFLGIPFFKSNGEMNGMVGLSNRPGGYSERDIEFLEPVTVMCANLIQIYLQMEQNHYLINSLEESVLERTSELERANAELEEANRRMRQAAEQQLEHFACMSHEIRTPLNCIIGMGCLLKESQLTTRQAESIQMIVTSGDLLMAIVNDVLDYSKLETENVVVDVKKNSLQDTLCTVVQSIEMKSQCTQTVKPFFDSALPEYMHIDSRRLQQVLFNLLGNAVKFSPHNGVVEFTVEIVASTEGSSTDRYGHTSRDSTREARTCPFGGPNQTKAVLIAADDDELSKRLIRFVVKDYGKGIDRKDFGRIFEPFHQASSGSENFTGGTGLGLAITKKLVTAMGGNVSVNSVKGSWTSFTVDLPCPDEPAPVHTLASKMQHWRVSLVGVLDKEKENVFRVFRDYKVDFTSYDSFPDGLDVTSKTNSLSMDATRVLLVNEDLFDDAARQAVLKCPDVTTISFGPKFSLRDDMVAHHVRSLEQILPCVLMETLITTVSSRKTKSTISNAKTDSLSFPQLRVLVAEDNLINQKVMAGMLARLGVQHVDIVENGLKACEREEAQVPPYDVILMDQQMPVMGGVEACRRIVNRPGEHKKPPIVFVTAHVSPKFQAECLSAGGSDYIPKPFKLDQIASTFRTVCGV